MITCDVSWFFIMFSASVVNISVEYCPKDVLSNELFLQKSRPHVSFWKIIKA